MYVRKKEILKFFLVRVTRHWKRWPREDVHGPGDSEKPGRVKSCNSMARELERGGF